MAQTNSRKYQMRSSPIRGLSQQALGHFFSLFLYLYFCFVFVILKWYARLSSWYFWNHECSLFMQENNSENENGHKPTSETESNAKIRDVKNSTRKKTSHSFKIGIPLVAQNNFVVANEFHLDEFKFNQYGCFMLHLCTIIHEATEFTKCLTFSTISSASRLLVLPVQIEITPVTLFHFYFFFLYEFMYCPHPHDAQAH